MFGNDVSKGILSMAVEDILLETSYFNCEFDMRLSYVEIYNETVRDLLSDRTDTKVSIREDPQRGMYSDAIELMVSDLASITAAVKKGMYKYVS